MWAARLKLFLTAASLVFDKNANLVKQLPLFEEAMEVFELKDDGTLCNPVTTKLQTICLMENSIPQNWIITLHWLKFIMPL